MAAVVKIVDSLFFQFLHCRGEEAAGFEVSLSELWDIPSAAWLTGWGLRPPRSALAWEPAATSGTLHYPPGYQIRTSCRPCAPFMSPARMSQRLNRVSDGTRCLWLTGGVFTIMVVDIKLRPSWRRQIGGPHLWWLALFQVCFFWEILEIFLTAYIANILKKGSKILRERHRC